MSKRKRPEQQTSRTGRVERRAVVIVTGLVIALALAAVSASRGKSRAATRPGAGTGAKIPAATPAQSQQPPLAKEYVYLGSRLVATEEPQCNFSLSLSCALFANTGGQGSVNVTAGTGCSWTATSNASWLTISSDPSGTGSGIIAYVVRDNTSATGRQATITVANLSFTVMQHGTAGCSYTISPKSAVYSADGGTGSVSVTAASECPWKAVADVNWVRITSSPCGMGNGSVNYTVDPNTTGVGRDATITVGGKVFPIKQLAG